MFYLFDFTAIVNATLKFRYSISHRVIYVVFCKSMFQVASIYIHENLSNQKIQKFARSIHLRNVSKEWENNLTIILDNKEE